MTGVRGFAHAAAFAAAVAVLCVPAVWNRFPLLFDDVGGYLYPWWSGGLSNGRSTVYGGFLWFTAAAWWVPAILLQALSTVWTLDRLLAVFGLRSPSGLFAVVAATAATSGAAVFASQVMPDAWAAPSVIALHLLAWHRARLTRREQGGLMAIVAFAAASHMATLIILAGLLLVYAAAWLFRRRLAATPDGLGAAALALAAGLVLLPATNAFVTGRFALTPGGDAFLFGRLVGTGIVGDVLAAECPRAGWRFCSIADALPRDADAFLWNSDSPIHALGGWDDPALRGEMGAIARRALLTHPAGLLCAALASTAEQLATVEVGDSTGPLGTWSDIRWTLDRYAPQLAAPYERSRQAGGEMVFPRWSRWVVEPLSILGTALLPFSFLALWKGGRRREAMLPAAVLVALLGNAFVCGTFSGPHGRYQARLAWLAPLVVGLGLGVRRSGADQAARALSVSAMRGAK